MSGSWNVPPVQLFTNALLQMLKGTNGLARVYDTTVPPDATYPYWMLLAVAGGEFSGPPLWAPEADAQLVYQLDSVGSRRDQAQWAADRAVQVMVGRTDGALDFQLPSVPGWAECARMRTDVPGGVEPEGAPPNVVYTVPNRFIIAVTPT